MKSEKIKKKKSLLRRKYEKLQKDYDNLLRVTAMRSTIYGGSGHCGGGGGGGGAGHCG